MIQQYIKGKSIEEILILIKDMNVDDFFIKIDNNNLRKSIPSHILKEKAKIWNTNSLIKELIIEQNFDLLPRDKDGVCYYDGHLGCTHQKIKSLPDNLTVNGYLNCSYNDLTTLPKNLNVVGDVHCCFNKLTSLSNNLNFNASLNIHTNDFTELPDNLTINGELYCMKNYLTSLPDNLKILGSLNCSSQKNKIKLEKPKSAVIKGRFKS